VRPAVVRELEKTGPNGGPLNEDALSRPTMAGRETGVWIVVEVAAGVVVNLYLLAGVGLGVGLIAGFAGVSGGYLLTPILMILGFPAPHAVGTAQALQAGNNLIGILRHRRLGHVDLKMGIIMATGALFGAEIGLRALHHARAISPSHADIAVLSMMMIMLGVIAVSMAVEVRRSRRRLAELGEADSAADEGEIHTAACEFLQGLCIFPHIRFTKSKLRISAWIVLGLGVVIGLLSGFLGVGGGFMSNPALIYLVGQPSLMAVGTNLIAAFTGVTFGCFRNAMLGVVHLPVALVMLLGTAIGTQLGALGTSWVKGIAVRSVLAASVSAAILGPAIKLAWMLTGSQVMWLDQVARLVALLQIAVPVALIALFLVMGYRRRCGGPVPAWVRRMLAGRPDQA